MIFTKQYPARIPCGLTQSSVIEGVVGPLKEKCSLESRQEDILI